MVEFVGFLTLLVVVFLLMKGKCIPVVTFSIVPVAAAFVLGYSPAEVGKMIESGLGSVWKTAVLFIFSVSYFGVVSDAGMFDPIVSFLIKKAGANVVLVTLATAVVAILGHLDGATATTVLITIPAMLPIYRKMNIRPTVLLLITGVAMGVMNLVPWGGSIVRVATVLNMDVTELWHYLLPFQVVCIGVTLLIALLLGIAEKRRGAGFITKSETVEDHALTDCKTEEADKGKRPGLTVFNIILTMLLIFGLTFAVMPSNILFMIAFSIAVAVNYPGMKAQRERFKAHAGESLDMAATLLAAGVFIGIMNEAGLLEAMVDVLLTFIPSALGHYMNIIAGVFSLPVGAVLGADTFYYGVFPILGDVAATYGVPAIDVGVGMLIGKNVGMLISPLQPTTFLACGLAGVELGDHIKANFKWFWLISFVMIIIAIMMGLMKIY